jgi:hypothetical protein
MRLTAIVPLSGGVPRALPALQALAPWRARGHRVVLVEGGSHDDAPAPAVDAADRIVQAPHGWARQANAGARTPEAEGADALVFLSEATCLPPDADRAIARALDNGLGPWGFFDLSLIAPRAGPAAALSLRLARALANAASALTGVGMAEQAIFCTRAAFLALDGFRASEDPPDIGFCLRARLLGRPALLRERVGVPCSESGAMAILARAARRECWRAALAMDLRWQPRRDPRWTAR